MGRVTIYDVARRAGVSHQTVSRVLNDRQDVADATRQRVRDAISDLGYVPQAAARTLGSGQPSALGLLMWSLAHPYWSRLAQGVQTCCSSDGLGFMVGSSHGRFEEERRQLDILLTNGVGGIAVMPCDGSDILDALRGRDVAVVAVGDVPVEDMDAARVDDAGGTEAVTQLLLDRGRERIGFLNGPESAWQSGPRQRGYRAALASAGIAFEPGLVRTTTTYTTEAGVRAALSLLDSSSPPDALVAATPALARGMLAALRYRNLRVPEDVAVAAFTDGVVLPEEITYATCEPIEELGRQAARMLLDRIGGYMGPSRTYVLGHQLHVGASSG